jgi:translation initiation factor 5A
MFLRFQLIDISGEGADAAVSLLKDDGSTKDDLNLPVGELGEQIKAAFDDGKDLLVSVLAAMGMEAIISFKENVSSK